MNTTKKEFCPGCGRHCDLSNPNCGKGREFAKTGVLPERSHSEGHNHGTHTPRCHGKDMNDNLILTLRDISHMMRMQYEGKASQKRILILLHEAGTITQKELTERLGVQPGSASEILSKLENAGLIIRTQNETDRRTTDIQLADAGKKLALEAAEQRQKRHEEMFFCLTTEEKTTLLSLLEKICTDWEHRYTGHPAGVHHGHHAAHDRHSNKHCGRYSHHGKSAENP